ncbi:hypothetical protein CVIRNUC_000273 [Coccomyxa viridis]|uniref:Methyltransferase FkbM domain-containing protein n=1 Tax=Coccomyxa viridis TaxID=1274662 RepID=A0AAV1HTQ2_9CHLO|nr:hypothetical protein CVIRNUC_000273 [Coccomyxa viridis]
MCSMMLKGCTLCLSVVALLLTAAARSTDIEEVEVAMPLRTFLPRWYKHSCGLNRECLAVHERQHDPEDAFYAQDEEDEAAEQKYFSGTHAGIFVELGATDGELFSNTKFFEDHRGWRGLLIEPNLLEFEKIPAKRPNAIAVHAAICSQEQLVHFVGKGAIIPMVGNSAGPLAGIWEFMTPEFKKQWFRKKAHELPADAELVSCVPLGLVLEMFGIRHIDFLSLDVEGAELEVLKTVNLTQVSVDVLVVEMDGSNPGKDEAVRELLAANHFKQDKAMKNTKAGLRNEWFIGEMFSPKDSGAGGCPAA